MLQHLAKTAVRKLPTGLAFNVAWYWVAQPTHADIDAFDQIALATATRSSPAWSGRPIYSWGDGPSVLLIHGWGGRAAQMARLGQYLSQRGMRAVAFDAAGHGERRLEPARWQSMINDIGSIARILSPLAACIGHSAGGLTMMAARRLEGLAARKYVCIASPSHPYPPVQKMARTLEAGEAVLERYKRYLARQFQMTWDELAVGRAFADAGHDLLLCYDDRDRLIDHREGDRIHARCPGSSLLKSSGHGHVRILSAPDTMAAIAQHIASDP